MKLYERIRFYIENAGLSQGDVAHVLGLPVRKFNYYLTEKSQANLWPLLEKLLVMDSALSRNWLYFGEGEMRVSEKTAALSAGAHCMVVPVMPTAEPLRLTGLADCSAQGWYSRAYKSVNVSPPHCGADWIAVLAVGDSMVPHGIREGYTLFCDPAQTPAAGEAVYAQRRDGSATIKVYKGRDSNGWIVLQGWLPQSDTGVQKPYLDSCVASDIVQMAPVIYMKCRL